jgi:3-phenylpropionate/trans-cinnamate dioxygenase ferredoxin reductase subunit
MEEAPGMLIIGAGQAGGRAASALRKKGYEGRITLVGEEPHRPYERPPLSKAVLMGQAPEDTVFLQKNDDYQALDLDWRPGCKVRCLDPRAQRVVLNNGEGLHYARCLLATGGRVRELPGVARGTPNVYYLRSLDDACELRDQMRPDRKVAVLGGGFLGLEFASAALDRGMDVTVLEAAPQLLARVAPEPFGRWLGTRYEEAGARVLTDTKIEAVESTSDGVSIHLGEGEPEHFEFLLVSIGQIPNVELARQAGIEVDNGIVVDVCCETSAAGVFAAGDCAAQFNAFLGKVTRFESWQNAQEQASLVAAAMLDQPVDSQVIPWFWSDQLQRNIQMLGTPSPDYEYRTRGQPDRNRCSVYGFEGNTLKYAIAVSGGKEIPPLRKLLASGAEVDSEQLTNPAIPVKKTVKAAMAAVAG